MGDEWQFTNVDHLAQWIFEQRAVLPRHQCDQIAKQLFDHQIDAAYLMASPPPPGLCLKLATNPKLERLKQMSVMKNVMRPEIMSGRWLAEYLADHPYLFANRVVVNMGCGSGIHGLVMALLGAKKVFLLDVMTEACENTKRNIVALGLESTCECICSDLFEGFSADGIELIVFNHPFFPASALPEFPVSRTMMAEPALLKRFLEQAQRFNCPVIMPFFTKAAEGLPLDRTNDPVYWSTKLKSFVSTIQRSQVVEQGTQKGHHRVYQLDPRTESVFQSPGHVWKRGDQYEETDWGDTIMNSLLIRSNLDLSDSNSHSFDPKSPSNLLDLATVMKERVGENLALRIFDSCTTIHGVLQVYYGNEDRRIPTTVISKSLDVPWPEINNVYKSIATRLQEVFDPTLEILRAFTHSESSRPVLPVVLELSQTTDDPAFSLRRSDALSGLCSAVMQIQYSRRSGAAFDSPSAESIFNELTKLESNTSTSIDWLLDREQVNRFVQSYLTEGMSRHFEAVAKSNVDWKNDFVIILLPVWSGTQRRPVGIGSLVLFCIKRPSDEELFCCFSLAAQFLSPVRMQHFRAQAYHHARLSAVGAIIGRNMSHNFGSHVLAGLSKSDLLPKVECPKLPGDLPDDLREIVTNSFDEVNKTLSEHARRVLQLTSYLQQRMDFLARATTEWPLWREPMFFFQDVMRGFLTQTLLLNKLVRDEGYAADRIEFRVKGPYGRSWVSFYHATKWDDIINCPDFFVAIPAGTIGKHALYGFFENAIRNAAKHNKTATSLVVFLCIEESQVCPSDGSRRFFSIKYCDNVSKNERVGGSTLYEAALANISESAVDKYSLERTSRAWGIQEMKTYADFLIWPFHFQYCSSLKALKCIPEGHDFEVLGYALLIQRANIVSVFSRKADETKAMCSVGVSIVRSSSGLEPGNNIDKDERFLSQRQLDLIHLQSPSILLIPQQEIPVNAVEVAEQLASHRSTIPARILVAGGTELITEELEKRGMRGRVMVCNENLYAPLVSDDQSLVESAVVSVYLAWLMQFGVTRSIFTPFRVAVYFNRSCDNSAFRRWNDLRQSCKKYGIGDNVIDIILIGKEASDGVIDRSSFRTRLARGVEQNWILFDNHGAVRNDGFEGTGANLIASHSVGSGGATNNHIMFDRLSNVPSGFPGVLFLLQLIESLLLKVLIIDERILRAACRITESFDGSPHLRQLVDGNVFLCPTFSVDGKRTLLLKDGRSTYDGLKLHRSRGDTVGIPELRMSRDGSIESLQWLGYDSFGPTCRTFDACNQAAPFFDVAIIHVTLLEELAKDGVNLESLINSLRSYASRISLTSGRGKPATSEFEGLAGLPFIEFAALEQCLVQEFSKASLGNVLQSLF